MAPGLLPESIDYIVSVVLGQTLDSQLAQVFKYEEIRSYLDLSDLIDSEIGTLQFTKPILDKNGNETGEETLRPISRHACKLISLFNAYCRYRFYSMNDPITIDNCIEIDPVDFINFRQSQFKLQFLGESFVTLPSSKRSPAQKFSPTVKSSRTVKIDNSNYPTLREDSVKSLCNPLKITTGSYSNLPAYTELLNGATQTFD